MSEGKVNKKPHLSPSQILMMQRCPAQWYYRYVCGFKVPPSGAMSTGSALHAGAYHNYSQKIESHEDLPTDDVLDAFSTDFEARKSETQWNKDEKPEELKDKGARALDVYQTEVASSIQPTLVEDKARLEIPNFNYDLIVVPDLIQKIEGGKESVRDIKFTTKSPDGVSSGNVHPKVSDLTQLTFYALARSEKTGEAIEDGSLDYCVGTKKSASAIPVPVKFTTQDFQYAKNMIALTARQIELEHYPPNRQSIMCSRRYCGYFNECEKHFGGKVKE